MVCKYFGAINLFLSDTRPIIIKTRLLLGIAIAHSRNRDNKSLSATITVIARGTSGY